MGARILIGQIKHETNTFSRLPTDLDCYGRRLLAYGEDVFRRLGGTRTEIGGYMQAAKREGWTLIPTVAADATPSGKLTAETWAKLSGAIIDGLERAGKVDGVLLALHGAMVTEDQDDGEGDLLQRIRARVGPDVPVMATLDLHANVTEAMTDNADALIAYRTAWLKANRPHEFYAAAMGIEIAAAEKLAAFRQEILARGLELLPPDVNRSDVSFTVEERPGGRAVRFALAAIKGVGEQAMRVLVEERGRGGPFTDLFDLALRVGSKVLNRRLLEALIQAGALDSLEPCRRRLFEAVEAALRWAQAAAEARSSGQASLFGGETALPDRPPLPAVADWPASERLQRELQVLGFYLSAHPLDAFGPALQRLGVVPAVRLVEQVEATGRTRQLVAGVPLGRQERAGERGRWAFVQFSDPTGQFEATFFAELLGRSRELLDAQEPLLLEVEVRVEDGAARLVAQQVERLEDRLRTQPQGTVEIRLERIEAAAGLAPLLAEGGRGARVRLVVPNGEEEVVLALPERFALAWARRPDVARLPGVAGLRELQPR